MLALCQQFTTWGKRGKLEIQLVVKRIPLPLFSYLLIGSCRVGVSNSNPLPGHIVKKQVLAGHISKKDRLALGGPQKHKGPIKYNIYQHNFEI